MKNNFVIPTPITDSFAKDKTCIDSAIADSINTHKVAQIFSSLRIDKRTGESNLKQVVYALLIMPLFAVDNINCFAGKFLDIYIPGGKDVLYYFLSRQNINWAVIQLRLAQKIYRMFFNDQDQTTAFAADDTIKIRCGKKVQAMSSHYDHNSGRHVMGQQILQFGIAGLKGFLPLLSQIYVGQTRRTKRSKAFNDQRSALARSYHRAHNLNKHQMLSHMLKKALSYGFYSSYLIADSWFGCRDNVRLALDCDLTAIFMMKRNGTKYRYQGELYTLKGLYRLLRKNMKKLPGKGYSYFSIVAEYNLSNKDENWQTVKLIFSRAPKSPKNSWVVLLCTDFELEDEKIYQIYALRWSIEVYFKEIKQNFGFLKEQTGSYETHYASIHLAAMRYTLLYCIFLRQHELGFSQIRKQIGFQMELLSFTCLAWDTLRALIYQVIDQQCRHLDNEFVQSLKNMISLQVTQYLHFALQIDPESSKLRIKAEKSGY